MRPVRISAEQPSQPPGPRPLPAIGTGPRLQPRTNAVNTTAILTTLITAVPAWLVSASLFIASTGVWVQGARGGFSGAHLGPIWWSLAMVVALGVGGFLGTRIRSPERRATDH